MATIGHRAYRELLESFGGCDLYYSEMVGAAPFLHGGRFESFYADPLPRPDKLVFQVVGPDAEKLAKTAAILDGRGVFGVDINMGCSAPEIARTGAGVAWMRDEEGARRLIALVRSSVKGRLSVKLRLGQDEDFARLVHFCQALQEEGVQQFTLHPRTANEKLRRRARWDYIGLLRAELSVPVAGNGDVGSAREAVSRLEGPCDGVMIGRAAVREPWIFSAAKALISGDPSCRVIDLEDVAARFVDLLLRHQPPEFWETRSRRFFHYYCDNLTWAHYVRTQINRETEPRGMLRILREHLASNPEERYVRLGDAPQAIPRTVDD